MNAIPEWRKPAVNIPVQDLREFIAKYGPDVAVLVTWDPVKIYQFVTIGSDGGYANAAVRLRNILANKLGAEPLGPTLEDRRSDHPNVSLDKDQLAFLLWALGHLYAEADQMNEEGREFFMKHHDQLFTLLGNALENFKHQPK